MFTYKNDNFHVPIKVWIQEKDYYADVKMVEQVEHLAKLPFAFHHIALSSDGHLGMGMPIGGILATENVVIPNAVGTDCGCGMCAIQLSITEIDRETLKNIMSEIRKEIPLGFNKHQEPFPATLMPNGALGPICEREFLNARKSLGTLGGGNHFIEIQQGLDNHIWIMIHSGSRNLGKQVADYYNNIAITLNEKWHSKVPKEWQLAFLPVDSDEGEKYLHEMEYCVKYALANRQIMMNTIIALFKEYVVCVDEPMINIAHNYVVQEHHFGKDVWVHRKGATLAQKDTIGIIPGSQGTTSYIVRGRGNPESFNSCSHGAGRALSRTSAKQNLSLEVECKRLDDLGIIHTISSKDDLDEAPGAYKDITKVMNNQLDLVEIVTELRPLAVIKG